MVECSSAARHGNVERRGGLKRSRPLSRTRSHSLRASGSFFCFLFDPCWQVPVGCVGRLISGPILITATQILDVQLPPGCGSFPTPQRLPPKNPGLSLSFQCISKSDSRAFAICHKVAPGASQQLGTARLSIRKRHGMLVGRAARAAEAADMPTLTNPPGAEDSNFEVRGA